MKTKTIVSVLVVMLIGSFSLAFYVNKHVIDDTCYSSSRCYPTVMASEDLQNIVLSSLETVIFPITVPINLYLLAKYNK